MAEAVEVAKVDYRCVLATSVAEIDEHADAWEALERRSIEPNFYLSYRVVRAGVKHYASQHPLYVVFVYAVTAKGQTMVACAPFTMTPATRRVPVPALTTFRSPHTYICGALLDRDHAEPAVSALWDWIEAPEHPWRLVVLRQINGRSRFWSLVSRELERRGREHWIRDRVRRAILRRADSFQDHMARWSSRRRKSYRQRIRGLGNVGRVEWRVHRELTEVPELSARFMQLEEKGWKGEAGTALAQSEADTAFFDEITAAYAEKGQLFFVELLLDGRPIAMTANFRQGSKLFAFKVAYDPALERFSPGIMAEIETIRRFHEDPDLFVADGGTAGPSYLDRYWQDATEMLQVVVSTGRLPARACLWIIRTATLSLRSVRETWSSFRARPGSRAVAMSDRA